MYVNHGELFLFQNPIQEFFQSYVGPLCRSPHMRPNLARDSRTKKGELTIGRADGRLLLIDCKAKKAHQMIAKRAPRVVMVPGMTPPPIPSAQKNGKQDQYYFC
eukprot:4369480-Ditylum_brightwellii.AAC.1